MWEHRLVAVLRAASVPLVNVLLCILTGEVAVVFRLPQMLGARLVGMTFRHVIPTGITHIPVRKPFHEVRVRGGLDLLCLGRWCIISSACCGRRSHVPWCPSCHDRYNGWSTSCSKNGWATATTTTTSTSLAAASTVVGASESIGGIWGRRWRRTASLASNVASSVALIERKSRHLLHHLMLILMEEILLLGQCILLEWQGGCISLMARGGGCRF